MIPADRDILRRALAVRDEQIRRHTETGWRVVTSLDGAIGAAIRARGETL